MITISKFKISSIFILIISYFLCKIAKNYPDATNILYSNGLNKILKSLICKLTSKIPFSIFETCIILIIIYITIKIIKIIFVDKNKKNFSILSPIFFIFNLFCIIIFFYTLLFGLNYYRTPLQKQIINTYNKKYDSEIKISINNEKLGENYKYVLTKLEETKNTISHDSLGNATINTNLSGLIIRSESGYKNASKNMPTLSGTYSQPKELKLFDFSKEIKLTRFYFSLFNEANISKNIPDLAKPFFISTEMAYQRGFSYDSETKFIGYLASINNNDANYNYSGYLTAAILLQNDLEKKDITLLKSLEKNIDKNILKDMNKIKTNIYWDITLKEKNLLDITYIHNFLNYLDILPEENNSTFSDLFITYYSLNPYK